MLKEVTDEVCTDDEYNARKVSEEVVWAKAIVDNSPKTPEDFDTLENAFSGAKHLN
jgi:hypothetical protein